MRIGVFGGTFDPVHFGHLIMAEQCREQGRLDQVLFVPAALPPHKQSQPISPFGKRVEMLALAIAGHSAFRVDELEKSRPGPSFTVDTLRELQDRHTAAELTLIMGADCLPDLAHWREPERIAELAMLAVVGRPGWSVWPPEQLRSALRLPPQAPLRQMAVHAPLIDISSRDLRRRAAEGRSLRYLVPRAVEEYIAVHQLYQQSHSTVVK
jgi:nicotinate-nucleotide adenylyltransferase